MTTLQLELTDLANGGAALGRGPEGRVFFVPFAIPGERVQAEITRVRDRYAEARLVEVLRPSADRVAPRCRHFTVCGGCQLQHVAYPRQLVLKQQVVRDQLERIGHFSQVTVHPTLPNPAPYGAQWQTTLSPAADGGLGYWAPAERQVLAIQECPILHPVLQNLLQDIDLDLPDLRKLSLRVGADDEPLVAFEIQNVDPPALEADFPLSATIILPDRTTANLIGDNWSRMRLKEQIVRVTAGVRFPVSPGAAERVIDTVLGYAALTGGEGLLELHSGVGWLTAFLAPGANLVACVEPNPDAIADATVNLDQTENVALYQGAPSAILPALEGSPDVVIIHPGTELDGHVLHQMEELAPERIVYLSEDAALLARDGRGLQKAGFALQEVQPVDMFPQQYPVFTVSLLTRVDA